MGGLPTTQITHHKSFLYQSIQQQIAEIKQRHHPSTLQTVDERQLVQFGGEGQDGWLQQVFEQYNTGIELKYAYPAQQAEWRHRSTQKYWESTIHRKCTNPSSRVIRWVLYLVDRTPQYSDYYAPFPKLFIRDTSANNSRSGGLLSLFEMEKDAQQPKMDTFVGINGEVTHLVMQMTGLGFANRDERTKNEQDQGMIEFVMIHNDERHQSMRKLLDLKNIFSRQLPKMPKEYIVKLVFDRNHEAMIIQRNGTKVIGGICFRMFPERRFTEVVFLAITANEQVKGYGTRLMNKFKEEMQRRNVEYLMTYADNFALGYFRKQGFTKEYRMAAERWKGYIKDYEGGTMMECYIHPKLDYSRVSEIIKLQKQLVIEKIKQMCINSKEFDGSTLDNLNPYRRANADGVEQEFKVNPESIPGVLEGGWTWAEYDELKKTKERSFQIQCLNILEEMKKHKSSWPFLQPVAIEDVPDYHLIVKEPIDIKTIERKLQNNEYQTKQQFVDDIYRIFSNCQLYNQQDSIYYKCSLDLESFVSTLVANLRDKRQDSPQRDRKGGKSKVPSSKKKIKKERI